MIVGSANTATHGSANTAALQILKKYYGDNISAVIADQLIGKSRIVRPIVFCGRRRIVHFANWQDYRYKCMTPFLYGDAPKCVPFKN